MNKVLIQVWELSDEMDGSFPDGCSVHADEGAHRDYLAAEYGGRTSADVPPEYSRALGVPVEAYVDDHLRDRLVGTGSIRLQQTSTRNLIDMGEIILKH